MKKLFLVALLVFVSLGVCPSFGAKKKTEAPEWVTRLPIVIDEYIGIGNAPISDANHREKARQSAIDEIAAQISVSHASSSFLRTVEADGEVKQLFEQVIEESLKAELSGHKLVDNYEGETHYYVFYKLNKKVYEKYVEKKRKEITDKAYEYLLSGKQREVDGELIEAMGLYAKGMDVVAPHLNEALKVNLDGKSVDIADELFRAYKGIFSGMALTSNLTQMEVEPFKVTRQAIGVCLSRNGAVIPNVMMRSKFLSGSGDITSESKTDHTGTAIFYVTNVTSKNKVQTINIGIDDSFIADLPKAYQGLISQAAWPQRNITLTIKEPTVTAYFEVKNNGLPQCESLVRSSLANNFFEITEDKDADLYIEYSSTFREGGAVDGELYQMKEYFSSLNVKIYKNKGRSLLAEYAIPERRVLAAASRTKAQAQQTCARELSKQLTVKLPAVLRSINLQ